MQSIPMLPVWLRMIASFRFLISAARALKTSWAPEAMPLVAIPTMILSSRA